MITEKLPEIKGWLHINAIKKDGSIVNLVDRENALTDNAKKIILYNLAGEPWKIISIKALKASSELATALVSHTFPLDNVVEFTARFDQASFNDTLDEVRLISESGLAFSRVTGLSVLKDDTLQLEVIWKLTIP